MKTALFRLVMIGSLLLSMITSSQAETAHSAPSQPAATSHHAHQHDHTAPHGGSLSTIEGCALGHVESKLSEGKLEMWFLDGGESISRSIPLPEPRFPLTLVATDATRLELIMMADPLRLAGEKAGRCSHFMAASDSLKGLAMFKGYAWVRFKGAMRPLQITYPAESESHDAENAEHHDHHVDNDPDGKSEHQH